MSESVAISSSPQLAWVENVGGQPKVRWPRLIAFGILISGFNAGSAALISWFAETPLRFGIILAFSAGMFAFLTVAVELQRQQVLTGTWRFRLSLQSCLLVMFFAGVFFAGTGNSYRSDLRGHAQNQRLQAELEGVIQGGFVSIGAPGGRRITCQITRPDFSDGDLKELIRRTSIATGFCELETLFLDATQTADGGVCQLSACPKLSVLSLPAMPLSDRAIDSLSSCRRLDLLLLDSKQLTPAQLTALRKALPSVRLNGKTWQQIDASGQLP